MKLYVLKRLKTYLSQRGAESGQVISFFFSPSIYLSPFPPLPTGSEGYGWASDGLKRPWARGRASQSKMNRLTKLEITFYVLQDIILFGAAALHWLEYRKKTIQVIVGNTFALLYRFQIF